MPSSCSWSLTRSRSATNWARREAWVDSDMRRSVPPHPGISALGRARLDHGPRPGMGRVVDRSEAVRARPSCTPAWSRCWRARAAPGRHAGRRHDRACASRRSAAARAATAASSRPTRAPARCTIVQHAWRQMRAPRAFRNTASRVRRHAARRDVAQRAGGRRGDSARAPRARSDRSARSAPCRPCRAPA